MHLSCWIRNKSANFKFQVIIKRVLGSPWCCRWYKSRVSDIINHILLVCLYYDTKSYLKNLVLFMCISTTRLNQRFYLKSLCRVFNPCVVFTKVKNTPASPIFWDGYQWRMILSCIWIWKILPEAWWFPYCSCSSFPTWSTILQVFLFLYNACYHRHDKL